MLVCGGRPPTSGEQLQKTLLVIDMQLALVQGAYREQQVLDGISSTITKVRATDCPVVYLQHNHATFEAMRHGAPGWQIHPQIAPAGGDFVVEKTACDGFYGTVLLDVLRAAQTRCLVVAGVQTEFCVDATVRAALSLEFDVELLSDCHTTGDSTLSAQQIINHHNAVLPNLVHPSASVRLTTSAEVTFLPD